MKAKDPVNELEAMIQHRFVNDPFGVQLKEHLEQKFREGKLEDKDWHLLLFEVNPFPDIVPDKPDDRIVKLTLFYNKLKKGGLTVLPGYTGCRECYYRYVFTSLCLINPAEINYQIIGHTLYQHLCFLWVGAIDLQWQMLHQKVPHNVANHGYPKIFEKVAIDHGFHVDHICKSGMSMRILWKDGSMYKKSQEAEGNSLDILPCHDCLPMGSVMEIACSLSLDDNG